MKEASGLTKAILKTIAYFDGLDMPLTVFDVYENLFKTDSDASYQAVDEEIQSLCSQKIVTQTNGFVTLPGRGRLVKERIIRGMVSEQKFKKTMRVISLLRFAPFVRMVGVCNTLAFDMARPEGDMDLFIIAKANRLYVARWIVTGIVQAFGMRRHRLHISDRICLSFFVDEKGIDMSRFELKPEDPYLAVWTKQLIPVFSVGNTYEKFWEANKHFVSRYLAHPSPYTPINERRLYDTWITKYKRKFLEILFFPFAYVIEQILRVIQRERMLASQQKKVRLTPTGVIVDNHTLKFHEEDRRVWYRERMQEGFHQLLQQKTL